jgi:hypothetical protein
VRQVQQHVRGAGAAHLGDNGTRHDVARRKLRHGVIARHEPVAGGVAQLGAFAAQGLGEQESRLAFQAKGGGVELHEFDIQDRGAGAIGHGDAVAGGHVRVGGVAEDAAEPAGGEQDGVRDDRFGFRGSRRIEQCAGNAGVAYQQVYRRGIAAKSDVGERGGRLVQRARDFVSGGIAVRVQDTVARVSTLSGVSVKVNNLPAAVYFVDPEQVSFQVPNGVSGTASVQVINSGQTSNTITAPAAAKSPGIGAAGAAASASKPASRWHRLSGGVQGRQTLAIAAGFCADHGGVGTAGDELRFDHAAVQHHLLDWPANIERASVICSV